MDGGARGRGGRRAGRAVDGGRRDVSHEPRRTCVACRRVRVKDELLRLVRLPGGVVMADERAHTPGRGAYVCRDGACVTRLGKGGRLSQAFRRPSTADPALVTAAEAVERRDTPVDVSMRR
jgi:uncharacterized protein